MTQHLTEIGTTVAIVTPIVIISFFIGQLSNRIKQHDRELHSLWKRIDNILELIRSGHVGECPLLKNPDRWALRGFKQDHGEDT